MDVFWNSNCQPPWDNWSMGLTDTPNSGPNNNPHEAWHRDLLRGRIPNMLRGSTEHVFEVALPQLIELDGLFKPTQLMFDVPAVPKGVMKKALWYVDNQQTHVHAFKSELGVVSFYVLQKDNEFGAKKISERLMQMWEAAKEGKKDKRIKDLDSLLALCDALHLVFTPNPGMEVLQCEANPGGYDCLACKGFKGIGICSHVVAVNHILTKYNVRHELRLLQTSAAKKKSQRGNRKRPVPALVT